MTTFFRVERVRLSSDCETVLNTETDVGFIHPHAVRAILPAEGVIKDPFASRAITILHLTGGHVVVVVGAVETFRAMLEEKLTSEVKLHAEIERLQKEVRERDSVIADLQYHIENDDRL